MTGHWFDVLFPVLTMAAVLGFYQALRQAGPVLWIAVVAFLTGIIFVLLHAFIRLGIAYELAPAIADASTAIRPALEVMASTEVGIISSGAEPPPIREKPARTSL